MKAKFTQKHFALAMLILTMFSCEDTTVVKNYTGTGEEETYSIKGYAQKGAFTIGSNITVSELNEDLYPTGRVFFATVTNNQGYFELPGIVLTSPYIQVKVEGKYSGILKGGDVLTLFSIADISETETVNINLITHLTKERIETLVQDEDLSFEEAETQALHEFLTVFNWENTEINKPSALSITDNNDGGAILLATETMFANIPLFTKELETITNFQLDFMDGDLDSETIKGKLRTSVAFLVVENAPYNFSTIYPDADVPDFFTPLNAFASNSTFPNYKDLVLPLEYNGRINMFRSTDAVLNDQDDYSFAIVLSSAIPVLINAITLRSYTVQADATSTFDASSSQWGASNEGTQPCLHSFTTTCFSKGYALYAKDETYGTIEAPISFSGTGEFRLDLSLSIDGHVVSFNNRQVTW